MQIIPDANATYLRYLYGQIDTYPPRAEEVLAVRQKIKAGQLHATLKEIGIDTGERFFCFNRNPRHYVKHGVTNPKLTWFTDPNFLRAVAHLIDKQGIINLVYHGLAVPAFSDVSPENKLFYNPNLTDYDYNPGLAAQILESGGYHMVGGRRTDSKGNPIEFNLDNRHRISRSRPNLRHLQAGPREPRNQGQLPAAGIYHAGGEG